MNGRPSLLALTFVTLTSAAAQTSTTQPSITQTFPLTIKNCGQTLTFESRPQRVLTTYSVTTELMLRLGLGSRIVGAADFGEPMPADLQPAYLKLNRVGKDYVLPREITLSLHPDLVFDNEPAVYDPQNGNATRQEFQAAGARLYTLTAKCGGGTVKARFEDIYTDLNNFGRLFGVQDRAQAVIREMKQTVADVRSRIAGRPPLRVMLYSGGEGPVGVFGPGTWDSVLRLAGGVNAFADLKTPYAELSPEEVARRDINAFVVVAGDTDAKTGVAYLRKTFPKSLAVRQNRIIVIDYTLINPGVRGHLGVQQLAKGLYPDAFRR